MNAYPQTIYTHIKDTDRWSQVFHSVSLGSSHCLNWKVPLLNGEPASMNVPRPGAPGRTSSCFSWKSSVFNLSNLISCNCGMTRQRSWLATKWLLHYTDTVNDDAKVEQISMSDLAKNLIVFIIYVYWHTYFNVKLEQRAPHRPAGCVCRVSLLVPVWTRRCNLTSCWAKSVTVSSWPMETWGQPVALSKSAGVLPSALMEPTFPCWHLTTTSSAEFSTCVIFITNKHLPKMETYIHTLCLKTALKVHHGWTLNPSSNSLGKLQMWASPT